MFKEYIEMICDDLQIDIPKVSYDSSKFLTDTMLALCDGGTIYIKPIDKPNPDYMFAIAHELRHLWQLKTDKDFYFEDYKEAGTVTVEDYNKQAAEVDANAYGMVVMADVFGLQPLFNGMSNEIVELIKSRAEEIN